MNQAVESLLTGLWVLVPIASLLLWTSAIVRRGRGDALILYQPRRAVPWGLIDLLVLFIALPLIQLVAISAVVSPAHLEHLDDLSAKQQIAVLTASQLANLLTLVIGVALIRWRTGAGCHDFGVSSGKFNRDVVLGVAGFVMLVVPVFALQFLLTRWMESKHPLVEIIRENPHPIYFALSGFSALIVAPIAEECLFRVVLQGWLEKVAAVPRPSGPDVLLGSLRASSAGSMEEPAQTSSPRRSVEDKSAENSYTAPSTEQPRSSHPAHTTPPAYATQLVGPSTWPIVVSASLFALAHFSHGPDPGPLFLLAIGLGYLYQRTHRVLPCIVVHFLLNLVSMLQLWVAAVQQGTGG